MKNKKKSEEEIKKCIAIPSREGRSYSAEV